MAAKYKTIEDIHESIVDKRNAAGVLTSLMAVGFMISAGISDAVTEATHDFGHNKYLTIAMGFFVVGAVSGFVTAEINKYADYAGSIRQQRHPDPEKQWKRATVKGAMSSLAFNRAVCAIGAAVVAPAFAVGAHALGKTGDMNGLATLGLFAVMTAAASAMTLKSITPQMQRAKILKNRLG